MCDAVIGCLWQFGYSDSDSRTTTRYLNLDAAFPYRRKSSLDLCALRQYCSVLCLTEDGVDVSEWSICVPSTRSSHTSGQVASPLVISFRRIPARTPEHKELSFPQLQYQILLRFHAVEARSARRLIYDATDHRQVSAHGVVREDVFSPTLHLNTEAGVLLGRRLYLPTQSRPRSEQGLEGYTKIRTS
jgi:hypothetical protein